MLSVINHSNVVSRVTERMLCGLEIDEDDWALLQFSMGELDTLLERRVKKEDLEVPAGSDDGSKDEDMKTSGHGRRNIFGGSRGAAAGADAPPVSGGGRRRSLWR